MLYCGWEEKMATTSFDTTFRINPDWGVKNLKTEISISFNSSCTEANG